MLFRSYNPVRHAKVRNTKGIKNRAAQIARSYYIVKQKHSTEQAIDSSFEFKHRIWLKMSISSN